MAKTQTKWTAAAACGAIINAVDAAEYLKAAAQGNVNADGVIIAETVKAGDDVEAKSIAGSFKTLTYVTKYQAAAKKALAFGELVMQDEAKKKAIPTTATKHTTLALV